MNAGRSVRLFLADGTPGGLLTAEIMNWTGHVTAAPRSELAALLKREEAARTGVYLLLGDDPTAVGGSTAYIGESDVVGARLKTHAQPEEQGGKDFWERAVILTSKDANLTKAHARYLESRFIELATLAGRATLANGTAPSGMGLLPEADVSDMEYYVDQARIILPVLGVNLLRSPGAAPSGLSQTTSSPDLTMSLKKESIIARARELDGEFTVLQGSLARFSWTGVPSHGYRILREKLERDGTLMRSTTGSTMTFSRDHVFASPSAAAAVIAGRASNGRKEWRLSDGTSFGDWQARGLS